MINLREVEYSLSEEKIMDWIDFPINTWEGKQGCKRTWNMPKKKEKEEMQKHFLKKQ